MGATLLIMAPQKEGSAARAMFEDAGRHHVIDRVCLVESRPGAGDYLRSVSENEFFWDAQTQNAFYPGFDPVPEIMGGMRHLLADVRPDAVYAVADRHFNYGLLENIRGKAINAPIYIGMEDYWPICPLSPHMLPPDGMACKNSTPQRCAECSGMPANKIWQRRRRFRHFLDLAEGVITASNYMRNRFLEWGMAPEKLYTAASCLGKKSTFYLRENKRNFATYGYFGPATLESGIQRFIAALPHLAGALQDKIRVDIYGGDLQSQPAELQDEINKSLARLRNPASVRWLPSPGKEEMAAAIFGLDWILAPALWGQGETLAMRMARQLQRPVVATDFCGFGERIIHDRNGVLVGGESPLSSWEDAFFFTAGNEKLWKRLNRDISPQDHMALVDEHLRIMGLLEDAWEF